MHHPGPPRFVSVGATVELAPRNPDPAGSYAWTLRRAPDGSTATVGDRAVESLTPDASGYYRVKLAAPDGTHNLTIRAFDAQRPRPTAGESGGVHGRPDAPATYAAAESRGSDDGPGRPRVRLDADPTGETVEIRAAPVPHPNSELTAADLDVEYLVDDRDAVTGADLTVDGHRVTVPRERLPGEARIYAVAFGPGGHSVPDAVSLSRVSSADGDAIAVNRPYEPPAWATESVIYEIYVRGFPGQSWNGDRSVFDAIIDRLDYIEELGVDVLWLTPVLQNDHAPHGYNTTDFFAIADDLGTRADYERFVAAAHERGLRVLFDFVANHSARDHPHFQAAVADPNSEYRTWYEWRSETEPETYFDWEYIANFDFTNLTVRRHLLDAAETWAPLVDGFRCDMAWAVPNGFWRELHDRLKAEDASFLLLDETIPYIPEFQAGLFDVHFDSTTYATLRQIGRGERPAEAVFDAVNERARIGFPDFAGFMLYAENHDETRYLVECGRPAAEAALGALFTLPGAPMVYAGQEFGQRGQRDALAWEHADTRLRRHVEQLMRVRTGDPALASDAALVRVSYDVEAGDADRVVAFGRAAADSAVIVLLNFGEATATVRVGPPVVPLDRVRGEPRETADGISVESVVVLPVADGDPLVARSDDSQ